MVRVRPDRVAIALAVPLRAGRLLVRRRPAAAHLGGSWEFPGGKIEPGEEPEAAARRELREEAGLSALRLESLALVVHDYVGRPLTLHVFLARDPEGEPRQGEGDSWSWVTPAELELLDMPPANRQILSALRWRVPG